MEKKNGKKKRKEKTLHLVLCEESRIRAVEDSVGVMQKQLNVEDGKRNGALKVLSQQYLMTS